MNILYFLWHFGKPTLQRLVSCLYGDSSRTLAISQLDVSIVKLRVDIICVMGFTLQFAILVALKLICLSLDVVLYLFLYHTTYEAFPVYTIV